MTIIVQEMSKYLEEVSQEELTLKVKHILMKLLLPKKITGQVVEYYFRKSIRVGAWRYLKRECRALLLVARKWPKEIKSSTLKNILYNIFLQIELYTLKGKALFYGIILALKSTIYKLHEMLKDVSKLLALGIFYLNNPPMYRIYG